jgi:hypothetical protein
MTDKMELIIQDTYNLYKEMLNLPDEERIDFYRNKLMGPFLELFEKMNMPLNPETIGSFPVTGYDTEMNVMLGKLKMLMHGIKRMMQLRPLF